MEAQKEQKLGLEEDDFWSEPWKTIDALQLELIGRRKTALIVDAPAQVDLGMRIEAPVLVFQTGSAAELSTPLFENLAVLVASRASDRATFVNTAQPAVTPPAGKPGTTWKGRTFEIGLRDRLDLPWEPAKLDVRLLMRERSTAPRTIDLTRAGDYEDAAVSAFLEQYRRPPQPVWPTPGDPIPSYERDEHTPRLADGASQGLALAVERVILMQRDTPVILRGAFQLKPRRSEHVPPPRPGADAPVEPRPTAIVPITLVVTGSKDPTPYKMVVRAPSYDAFDPSDPDAIVRGAFAIDLLALGLPAKEQTHFVWAFAGDVASEVAVVALVAPSSIPV